MDILKFGILKCINIHHNTMGVAHSASVLQKGEYLNNTGILLQEFLLTSYRPQDCLRIGVVKNVLVFFLNLIFYVNYKKSYEYLIDIMNLKLKNI